MTFEQALAQKIAETYSDTAIVTAYVAVVEVMDRDGDLQCVTLCDSQSPPWRLHGLITHGAVIDQVEDE